jgi:hypothetical protein
VCGIVEDSASVPSSGPRVFDELDAYVAEPRVCGEAGYCSVAGDSAD